MSGCACSPNWVVQGEINCACLLIAFALLRNGTQQQQQQHPPLKASGQRVCVEAHASSALVSDIYVLFRPPFTPSLCLCHYTEPQIFDFLWFVCCFVVCWESELTVIWTNLTYCAWRWRLLGDILSLMAASVCDWLSAPVLFPWHSLIEAHPLLLRWAFIYFSRGQVIM